MKSKKKKAQIIRPRGRPTKRSESVEMRIIEGLSVATPLAAICRDEGMPELRTVYNWMDEDPELSARIARARDAGWDRLALEALEISNTPVIGEEITDTEDGRTVKRSDMLGHRKLQIETRLKLLAKWDPKRYGDRIANEISGPEGKPLQVQAATVTLSPEQDAAIKEMVARARERVKMPEKPERNIIQ